MLFFRFNSGNIFAKANATFKQADFVVVVVYLLPPNWVLIYSSILFGVFLNWFSMITFNHRSLLETAQRDKLTKMNRLNQIQNTPNKKTPTNPIKNIRKTPKQTIYCIQSNIHFDD